MQIFQMMTLFILQYEKITFLNIIIDLYEKSLNIGKYKFSKILTFISSFGMDHWQQIVLFFFK